MPLRSPVSLQSNRHINIRNFPTGFCNSPRSVKILLASLCYVFYKSFPNSKIPVPVVTVDIEF